MSWRVSSLPNRWLDAIGHQLRVWPSRDRTWSFAAQVGAAAAAFLLSCWVTITSVSYFDSHKLLSEAYERIRTLQQASAELSETPAWRAAAAAPAKFCARPLSPPPE